jgi:cytochrome c-type biogenesis protein CcmF
MLLGFVLLAVAVVVGLTVWRAGTWGGGASGSALLSRESAMLGNAVLMVAITAIVLTGTLFPLLAEAVDGTQAAVGAGYFDHSAVPVALVVLLLMGIAPVLRPGRAANLRGVRLPAVAGLLTVALVGLFSRPGLLALAAFGLGAYVLAGLAAAAPRSWGRSGTAAATRRRPGRLLAHAGLAVVAIGVAASSAYTVSAEKQLRVGDTVRAGHVVARLDSVDQRNAASGVSARVRLALSGDAHGTTDPQLRYYPARDLTVSVPAIRSRPTRDVYATVLAVAADGTTATVRLAVNPLVGLVWLGGALTALGGLAAVVRWPARRRPAPQAAPRPEPEPVPAGSPA